MSEKAGTFTPMSEDEHKKWISGGIGFAYTLDEEGRLVTLRVVDDKIVGTVE